MLGGDGATPLGHNVEQWLYGESLPSRTNAAQRNLLGRAMTTRSRLPERLHSPNLLPLGSRVRQRLALDYPSRDELLACLEQG